MTKAIEILASLANDTTRSVDDLSVEELNSIAARRNKANYDNNRAKRAH